ncbi:MAG: HAD hydrolase-like protein [candidate division Zixibacteria bacterium]|nr:HAD hydrolase-like protein [candidate division Zixibacteria bacterium]
MKGTVIYFDLGNTLVYGPSDNRQLFEGAVDTIEELWWRGYKIGLLSNQQIGTTEADVRAKLDDYGLESYRFDVITISSEFDPPVYKPDAQIFNTAVSKAGHISASDKTVFITENIQHINAARNLGWRAIHKPYQTSCTPQSGECIEELSELLDLFPLLPVDIYIRDNPSDPGDDLYAGSRWWESPDLWIRHYQDGQLAHQDPEFGQDNWFYTRVHNRGEGIVRLFTVQYIVREWAGTNFVYPNDYSPYMAQAYGMFIDSDGSFIVWAKWNAADVPPVGTKACWLAYTSAQNDPTTTGAHVWEHNNLAQKNLTIVDLIPGESGDMEVVLGSRYNKRKEIFTFELHRTRNGLRLPVSLFGKNPKILKKLINEAANFILDNPVVKPPNNIGIRFLDNARISLEGTESEASRITLDLKQGSVFTLKNDIVSEVSPKIAASVPFVPAKVNENKKKGTEVIFEPGKASGVKILLNERQIVRTRLKFSVPKDTKPGQKLGFDLIQRDERGNIVGGIAVQINVKARRNRKSIKALKSTRVKKTAKKTRATKIAKKTKSAKAGSLRKKKK